MKGWKGDGLLESRALEGRVALVTGAAGGIGRATVVRLAAAGARVLAVDRDGAGLKVTAADLGSQALPWEADVTDPQACAAMVAEAERRWGGVHVLVNAAGISGRRLGDGPVHACTDAGWEAVIRTNLQGVFTACRAVLPAMLAGGGGSIINVASVLGLVGGGPLFATHAYAASKAGVIGLTRAMASYYAPQRIRVNAVCPGLIATPMAARALADPATQAHVAQMQPLTGGPGSAQEVAAAVLFLASDASALITGAVLPVDGGWTAQ